MKTTSCVAGPVSRRAAILLGLLAAGLPAPGLFSSPAQAASGAEVYQNNCSFCHDKGISHPGTQILAVTRGREFSILKERTDLTPDYIKEIVRHGLRGMPAYRPTEISDAELDALAKYLTTHNRP